MILAIKYNQLGKIVYTEAWLIINDNADMTYIRGGPPLT